MKLHSTARRNRSNMPVGPLATYWSLRSTASRMAAVVSPLSSDVKATINAMTNPPAALPSKHSLSSTAALRTLAGGSTRRWS